MDVQLIEADRVTNPALKLLTTHAIDGIEFDAFGSPRTYFVLRDHPGTAVYTAGIGTYDRIPAAAETAADFAADEIFQKNAWSKTPAYLCGI